MLSMLAVAGCAGPNGAGRAEAAPKPNAQAGAARPTAPRVGQEAPGFELRRLNDHAKRVTLASFVEKKPVVLFFGSYT